MPNHPPVLVEIEAFIARWQMAATTFGKLAVGDGELIGDLSAGRSPRPTTVAKIRRFMESYRG